MNIGTDLVDYVRESNRIEGIQRDPSRDEIQAHASFLDSHGSIADLERLVDVVAGASLRSKHGMDVSVGAHHPPRGGPWIVTKLHEIITALDETLAGEVLYTPFEIHRRYEKLHPFMDGNGRSGRALWAWHRLQIGHDPFALGFLHSYYYESLRAQS